MDKLKARDWIATVLVAAVAAAYIAYLVNGDIPFIKDPRGMSATGLILGAAAFFVVRRGDELDRVGKSESALAVASLALGFVALIFAETAAAEWLLAVFMISIAVVWAVELIDHAGLLPGHHPAGAR
ncbi:hypothetical protein [Nocardioides mesophilus]|uniref:Uncharacterized protein n=1 Tax=Nocardioides mesophilus TaxID=433659 RepID=A0A7G9R6F7_9ACTN|nr:hypothetical protein [Nocardioides mesophilus]QNN51182.1 hypothetical protein H9L09_11000 [Nocardioides mesophilus]